MIWACLTYLFRDSEIEVAFEAIPTTKAFQMKLLILVL